MAHEPVEIDVPGGGTMRWAVCHACGEYRVVEKRDSRMKPMCAKCWERAVVKQIVDYINRPGLAGNVIRGIARLGQWME